MRGIPTRLIAATAAALMGTIGLATLAGAAAPVEVEVVKLSSEQLVQLQQRIDEQLKNSEGGKQVGPNAIAYYDGAVIVTLTLPGETEARQVNGNFEVMAPLCKFEYACVYDNTNFSGDSALYLERFACAEINLSSIGWGNRVSSIHNNQTTNTQTYILNSARQILNANRAPSKVNDVGVGAANKAIYWRVC
jgi:hypothetical protein